MRVKYNDKQLMDAVKKQGTTFMTKMVIRVEHFAKELCPVDTGNLRRSITYDVQTDDKLIIGQVGTPVEYAPYVELGTRKMAARPYLRPALYGIVGREKDLSS